jgi:alkaline phosphatase
MKSRFLLGAALVAAPFAAVSADAQTAPKIKNVIVVVNDGGGPTVYDAYRMFKGKLPVTSTTKFKKTWVSTHPLRPDGTTNNTPGSDAQDPSVVYDSAKFWDTTPIAGPSTVAGYSNYPAAFAGYEWSRFAHPDSGNTASSLSNGVKTYNNAINVDGSGDPQTTIVDLLQASRKAGKRTGIVTTVEFSDATPSALGGAHNIARANRQAIAAEMFGTGNLDVIAGAGNPDFNNDGQPQTANYNWISQNLWTDLKNGTNIFGGNSWNFRLVQDKSEIVDLANGSVPAPEKLAMIVKAFTSLQFNRSGDTTDPSVPHTKEPFTDPLNANIPSHKEMTLAALNALGRTSNPKSGKAKGFYLMTEAGAVDRAEHANNTARMLEEMQASDETVQAIIDWVNRDDTDATWNNTLLVVTADHDHVLYGPDADRIPFQGLKSNGVGKTPRHKWFGPNHGTGLVPLYAYGRGADELIALATNVDTYTDGEGRTFGHGNYLDQTDVGNFLKAAVASQAD